MLRIGQVEATATQDGKYTDGSVAGGIAATRLRAAAFNAMQEELAHIVESAGLALDINDMTQVLKAIQKLTLSRANPFADIKSDGAAAISTALSNLGLPTLLDAKIRGDTCEVAGFVNGRASAPYMRNKTSDSVVQLATSESVNSGIPMIGVPFFWPSASMPNTLIPEWSDMVFLKLNNATFSAATYPKLALIWPSLTLTESRGEFIRIWDDGRGVDQGRGLLSAQSDAIRNITGSLAGVAALESSAASGFVSQTQSSNPKRIATSISSDEMRIADLQFSAVNAGVPTANENRPRNISFNFIVRAA